jgi:hypothetical protein
MPSNTRKYTAFISYVHQYRPWVEVLHRNLELALGAGSVFLDTHDIGSGQSWVTRIQEGLLQTEHLVLVATPEAFVSPRVMDEWKTFIAKNRGWQGRVHLLLLVDTPIPPFLDHTSRVDFREHTQEEYERGLRELLAGLRGDTDRRDPPVLPDGVEVPDWPASPLPAALRTRVVTWLEPWIKSNRDKTALAAWLGFSSDDLKNHASGACTASAALVLAAGGMDPLAALKCTLETLKRELDEELSAESDSRNMLTTLIKETEKRIAEREKATGRGKHEAAIRAYLSGLRERSNKLTMEADLRGDHNERTLDEIYVAVHTTGRDEEAADQAARRQRSGIAPPTESTPKNAHDRFSDHRCLFLVGDPGSGKTTFLQQLTVSICNSVLDHARAVPGAPPDPIPIRYSLERLQGEPTADSLLAAALTGLACQSSAKCVPRQSGASPGCLGAPRLPHQSVAGGAAGGG